ncbi:FT-interacting protein 3-like [Mercurialis annua]|uniref:FT-interacting protein 3-like n=1 Tax=Mercurialis annua TaxID=3986 RepID=UPI0021605FE6|nr:FT-interacting protein 3-like [Mercurialis annua]
MPPKEKPKEDYSLKVTKPNIGRGNATGNHKLTLVEQRHFLYVRIVRAKNLPVNNVSGTCDPFVELRVGNFKTTTRYLDKTSNPEWNQVFAFTKDRIQGRTIDILVRDKEFVNDEIVGCVSFDIADIPTRSPPDSSLAPQWYRLEDRNAVKVVGELMLAVWIGNQSDDAFSVAWHSDAASVSGQSVAYTLRKEYLSPRLWYLRINVIGAQDLVPRDKNRKPEVYVRAVVGNVVLRSRFSPDKSMSPSWNEELMFVAAEPFDDPLIMSVQDKEECLGKCVIPLQNVEKTVLLAPPMGDKWFNLERSVVEKEEKKEAKFATRLHLKVFLDGRYHVFDEPTYYCSDLRATSPELWPNKIGILELGILKAEGLLPIKSKDGRGTTDAYCVAKYGQKWVRTTTVVDCLAPKWNEQYCWDVYDPYTVITVGVFDNSHLQVVDEKGGAKDPRIGKVRIRLSTLETGRIYTHSYPLIVLQPNGLKKMGELHLAVKFSCASLVNLLGTYTKPLLPIMHYTSPFSVYQLDSLRHQAIHLLCLRLGRADPPLRKEVVEYMLDTGANMWSLRRGKANCERVMACLSGTVRLWKWFDEICQWKNPTVTILSQTIFIGMAIFPRLILPTLFMVVFMVGMLSYPKRPRHPPHMDTRLSHAETASSDELEEEFDTYPSSKQGEVMKKRYDRLRSIGGRLVTMIGDLATQLERMHSLLSWRDPRATCMLMMLCVIGGCMAYLVPFKYVAVLIGIYVMRPPRMRVSVPALCQNFLRRLPAKTDIIL